MWKTFKWLCTQIIKKNHGYRYENNYSIETKNINGNIL